MKYMITKTVKTAAGKHDASRDLRHSRMGTTSS